MPRTWSYRQYEHTDVSRDKRKGLPLAGWIIFGVTGAILCFTVIVCMFAMNPPANMENHGGVVQMPSGAYNNNGR